MPDLQRPTALRGSVPAEPTRTSIAPTADLSSDAIDFQFYSRALRRGWVLLLLASLTGAAAGFSVASMRPILYEGTTTLVAIPAPGMESTPLNIQDFRPFLENQTLVSEIISELRLNAEPYNLTPQRFISDRLTVGELRGINFIKVGVRLGDAALAADASRRMANKATSLSRFISQTHGSSVRDQLKSYLDQARERLQAAEKELLTFKRQAQVELLKADADAMLAERGDLLNLTIGIESERARLKTAQEELTKYDRVLPIPRAVGAEIALQRAAAATEPGTPPPPTPGKPRGEANSPSGLPGQDPRAVDPEMLDQTGAFVNPVYQTLEFQIATSRSRLAALERQRREMVDVRKLGGDSLDKLSVLYTRQMELARLQSSYDVAGKVYTDLLVKYEQAATIAVAGSRQLQIVDAAVTPDRPVPRRRGTSAALGLAAGLLAAGLIVIVRQKAQDSRTVK